VAKHERTNPARTDGPSAFGQTRLVGSNLLIALFKALYTFIVEKRKSNKVNLWETPDNCFSKIFISKEYTVDECLSENELS
jgi:hypothetical protein